MLLNCLAIPTDDYDAHIVLLFATDDMLFYRFDEFFACRNDAPLCIFDNLANSIDRELFSRFIGGFKNPVGVHSQALTGLDRYLAGIEFDIGHDS